MRNIFHYLQSTKVLSNTIMHNIQTTKLECVLRSLEHNNQLSTNSMHVGVEGAPD